MIPYGKQHVTAEDIQAVTDVLRSDFLTQGPVVGEFEKAFAAYLGARYAVAVSSGTAALHLAALALGVGPGSRVITTPITFAASGNCILYTGGEVAFADIEAASLVLDVAEVRKLLASKPKGYFSGIVVVDFAGYPVDLKAYRELADAYGLWIIEDACHAPGGFFKDSDGEEIWCGNGALADISIFSFHPVKHIAAGEGGMLTTNNKDLYEKLLMLRTHGVTRDPQRLTQNPGGWYYEVQELGYNYRLTDIQAALGLSQLKRAKKGLARRRELARRYTEAFQENKKITLSAQPFGHAYHLYVIQTPRRLELYNHLRTQQIFTQVHYIPMHLHPLYRQFGWKEGDFPVSEGYYAQCLSLPMFASLKDEEQQFVIEKVLEFLK